MPFGETLARHATKPIADDVNETQLRDWYRLDRTEGQEHALYGAVEKDTLRQQLTGWLAEAGVPVLVVRGFSSQSYADVVRDRVTQGQREAVLVVSVTSTAPARTSNGTGWPVRDAGAGPGGCC